MQKSPVQKEKYTEGLNQNSNLVAVLIGYLSLTKKVTNARIMIVIKIILFDGNLRINLFYLLAFLILFH